MDAVLYGRFSSRPKAKCQTETIDDQLDRCRAYADLRQYPIIKEFSDREASGGTMEGRPGLEAAIRLAAEHQGILICYSMSRLARNTADALNIVNQLHTAGAELALLDLQIDTSTPVGKLFFTISAAFHAFEREQNAKRTSEMMNYYQANGRRMSSQLPWGMAQDPADPKRMIPNENEQKIIEQVKILHAADFSWREIGRKLADMGMMGRGGKPLSISTLRLIVGRNPD